jgi:hypothetical protein
MQAQQANAAVGGQAGGDVMGQLQKLGEMK